MRCDRRLLWLVMVVLAWSILPLLAEGTNAPAPPPEGLDDDFTPALGILAALVVIIMVVVFMLLLGMGLAAGIIVFALAGALAAFGILSSSAAVGFVRRSPASGFRALFLQLGAAAGIPCGIAGTWLVLSVAHNHWSLAAQLLVGGTAGLLCGVLVAWLFNFAWCKAGAWILARYDRQPEKEQKLN